MNQRAVLQKNSYPFNIYALHGFLGAPSDWNFLNVPIHAVDLFTFPSEGLQEFATQFNQKVMGPDNVLIGYSMGGRLCLHVLTENSSKWKAAIIVSAHPGLQKDLRKTRLDADLAWFKRFCEEDFHVVMKEWNQQSPFLKSSFKIQSHPYSKEMFLQSLQNWSLGNQEDLREAIFKLKQPILWVVGEYDQKYVDLCSTIKFSHPKSKIWIAANSSHRVPWEIKKKFEEEIKLFLEGL